MLKLMLVVVMLLHLTPGLTMAQTDPDFQGSYNDWKVFSRGSGAQRICYALSEAQDKRPTQVSHGNIFFMIASWADKTATEQPNLAVGYPLAPSNPPEARIGSNKFSLYVEGKEAFFENDKQIVASMRKGSVMRINAVSTRGTATAYKFSLSGVTAALRRVKAICG